jgi:hypothetical protein
MIINFAYKKQTVTCYCFETGEHPDIMTLYLKKTRVDEAGIDPKKGITINVTQKED